jgi:glucose/arabinose dehydrogenase
VNPAALLFYRSMPDAMFPSEYADALFIAHHGSETRRALIGFRVDVLRLNESGLVRLAAVLIGSICGSCLLTLLLCAAGGHHAALPDRLPAEPGQA